MTSKPPCAPRRRGTASVEMALLLTILVMLLTFPLLLGRVFWYYAAVQSAAHDAARYLANVPVAEMGDPARGMLAVALARDIAAAETAELRVDQKWPVSITISCDDGQCDMGVPSAVTVLVRVRVFDPVFGGFTWGAVGDKGLQLRAKASMRYVGQ